MGHLLHLAAACLVLASSGLGQSDDFQRESGDRELKDALEGKTPPALQVDGWLNAGGKSLDLASLRGKVVLIDFWGTW